MTDKQRLIYDLSLWCAALETRRDFTNSNKLPAMMLNNFTKSIRAYCAMSDDAIYAALIELNKI